MILFDSLYDTIIETLISYKGLSVKQLHSYVNMKYTISLPNFYKIIQKLIDNQILIKEGKRILFHSRRVLGFLEIAENLKKDYFSDNKNISNLQPGQSLYHEATSIKDLDGVWGNWMIEVNKQYGNSQATFVYQSRPYYALGMQDTEIAFFSQVTKLTDVYFLTGNKNTLDIHGANLYTNIGVHALATNEVPFLKDGYCITVIGNYIFEVLYPNDISDYFKIFFDTIIDLEKLDKKLFSRIFEMKTNCKLTLRHDPIQAKSVKNTFIKLFQTEKTIIAH